MRGVAESGVTPARPAAKGRSGSIHRAAFDPSWRGPDAAPGPAMLAALAMSLLLLSHPPTRAATTLPAAMTADDMATLHKRLMDRVDAMDRSRAGIFNDDVTAMVSPYFPAGQPIADTETTLREQKLGALMPFRGKVRPDDGTMFASRIELMSETFDNLFVVLHFAYRHGPEGSLVLDHMRAYLRSKSM